MMDSKYLIFKQIPFDGKTKRFEVVSVSKDIVLGRIQYRPTWRQYVFEPSYPTVWNFSCLEEVSVFLKELK